MDNFTASLRCVDDFLIHPTIDSLEIQYHQLTMAEGKRRVSSPYQYQNDLVYGKPSASKRSASIPDLISRPSYLWHPYTSDEEVASPLEDDGDSIHSWGSFSFPEEELAESYNRAPQQCSQAHAVRIHAAGKATMISMPKVVDVPATRPAVRTASKASLRSSRMVIPPRQSSYEFSRKARPSQDSRSSRSATSRNNSVSSVAPNSPASTAPSSIHYDELAHMERKRSLGYTRHVPLLEAARAVDLKAITQPAPAMKRSESVASQSSSYGTLTTPRKTKKFSMSLGLSKIGKNFTRRDSDESRDEFEYVKQPEPIIPARGMSRTANMHRDKMVARAANERAPPISLPPFPLGEMRLYDDEDWPL